MDRKGGERKKKDKEVEGRERGEKERLQNNTFKRLYIDGAIRKL